MRIVSIGYMAVVDAEIMGRASAPLGTCELLPISGGVLRTAAGRRTSLPFDHDAIVGRALADLRRDLDRDDWAFGLLPETFSLRELQALHEAVRGQTLNKPAFRKRLIESGRLEATGEMETGKGFRPAELYRARRTDHAAD
jgi:8-oxo-dGTP diphosphatase